MENGKVVGAAIGCGAISKLHLGCMCGAGYRIGALCDVSAENAEARRKEFGDDRTRIVADYREVLADPAIDVVAILTPPALHCEQTVAALLAGKYVYCEKPVVRSLGEFDAIFAAEEKSGRRAYFTPGRVRSGETPTIRAYIEAGDLGDIYRVESKHWRVRGRSGVDQGPRWFADSRQAIGGILADMGLYFMDRALYLTGWPAVEAVSAQTLRPFPHDLPPEAHYDVEEHAYLMVRAAGNLTLTFELAGHAFFDDWTTNSLMMLGTKGGMHVRTGRSDEFRFLTEKDGAPRHFVEHRIDWKEKRGGDAIIYDEFAAAARGEGAVRTATSSREALVLHEIMAMAYLSSREGREVRPSDLDRQGPIFVA